MKKKKKKGECGVEMTKGYAQQGILVMSQWRNVMSSCA